MLSDRREEARRQMQEGKSKGAGAYLPRDKARQSLYVQMSISSLPRVTAFFFLSNVCFVLPLCRFVATPVLRSLVLGAEIV